MEAPLPTAIKQRAERTAGYEIATHEADKWQSIVKVRECGGRACTPPSRSAHGWRSSSRRRRRSSALTKASASCTRLLALHAGQPRGAEPPVHRREGRGAPHQHHGRHRCVAPLQALRLPTRQCCASLRRRRAFSYRARCRSACARSGTAHAGHGHGGRGGGASRGGRGGQRRCRGSLRGALRSHVLALAPPSHHHHHSTTNRASGPPCLEPLTQTMGWYLTSVAQIDLCGRLAGARDGGRGRAVRRPTPRPHGPRPRPEPVHG